MNKRQMSKGVWSSTSTDEWSPVNVKRHQSEGRRIICLSVSSVGQTKILNMSNNGGRPSNTSFIGLSCRHTSSVSIGRPMIIGGQ